MPLVRRRDMSYISLSDQWQGLDDKFPIFAEHLVIHANFAAGTQIAHHIPMQRRLIDAARPWDACAQGEVNGATHLLVEERIFRTAVYVAVVAEGKLT